MPQDGVDIDLAGHADLQINSALRLSELQGSDRRRQIAPLGNDGRDGIQQDRDVDRGAMPDAQGGVAEQVPGRPSRLARKPTIQIKAQALMISKMIEPSATG